MANQSSREAIAVFRMTGPDWEKALALARRIDVPHWRCQALAHVAYICPQAQRRASVITESFKAANSEKDLYSIVAVSASPLSVLAFAGNHPEAKMQTARLLGLISGEPHPVRRMEALYHLATGLWQDKDCFLQVLNRFREAAEQAKSWRVAQDVIALLPYVYRVEAKVTPELLALISVPKLRRRAEREAARIAGEVAAAGPLLK